MRRRTLFIASLVGAIGTMVATSPAGAQLCSPTADPCLVLSDINVPSGSVIDLGNRDFVIAANRTVSVQGEGLLTVKARNVFLDDGARIVAVGNAGAGGTISLTASGFITLDPSSRIDVSSGSAGAIDLVAATVAMDGELRALATTRDGDGGFISIQTTGYVRVAGAGIRGSAGDRFGCGGFMELVTGGSVAVLAPIEFKGGSCDGGDVDIDALGDINATAIVSTMATYEFGSGGSSAFTAGGNVALNGPITSTGAGTLIEGGGDGGDLDVIGTNVTIGGLVNLNGAGPDGSGGFIDVTALALLRLSAPLVATGAQEGVGGDMLLLSDGDIEVNSTVDLRAGFSGGSFDAAAGGGFRTLAATDIDASGTGSPAGNYGGTFDVLACTVTLPVGTDFRVTGDGPPPRALARIAGGGAITIGATIVAGARVELRHRGTPPVYLPGALIAPSPVVVVDASLPCCGTCSVTTTTTTSSSSSTASSTSSTSSTVTSSTATSSSTVTSTSTTSVTTSTTSTSSTMPLTTTSVTSPSTSTSNPSTVTTVVSTTTSTSAPRSCLNEPLEGYAAVECAITRLEQALAAQPQEALGGPKSAKRLGGKVGRTRDLVERSRSSRRAIKLLVRAEKKIGAFEGQVSSLLGKAKIEEALAFDLLDLSGEVSMRIEGLRTPR